LAGAPTLSRFRQRLFDAGFQVGQFERLAQSRISPPML
jgi:hypothetical protein